MTSHSSILAWEIPWTEKPGGLQSIGFLCPWDFPGKNTGVGFYALFQGIFPTQGLNPSLLQWQVGSLPLSQQGSQ